MGKGYVFYPEKFSSQKKIVDLIRSAQKLGKGKEHLIELSSDECTELLSALMKYAYKENAGEQKFKFFSPIINGEKICDTVLIRRNMKFVNHKNSIETIVKNSFYVQLNSFIRRTYSNAWHEFDDDWTRYMDEPF